MTYQVKGKRLREIEAELDAMHQEERRGWTFFDKLDEAIDECARHGLRVVMKDGKFRVYGGHGR